MIIAERHGLEKSRRELQEEPSRLVGALALLGLLLLRTVLPTRVAREKEDDDDGGGHDEGDDELHLEVLPPEVVAPEQRRRVRPAREAPSALLVLEDFPPGECEVLTPRIDPTLGDTWLPVKAHENAMLIVVNEDDHLQGDDNDHQHQ